MTSDRGHSLRSEVRSRKYSGGWLVDSGKQDKVRGREDSGERPVMSDEQERLGRAVTREIDNRQSQIGNSPMVRVPHWGLGSTHWVLAKSYGPDPKFRNPCPLSLVPSPETRVPSPEFRVPSPVSGVPKGGGNIADEPTGGWRECNCPRTKSSGRIWTGPPA